MPARELALLSSVPDVGVESVALMLTTSCNLRCAYCYQRRDTPRMMAPETLDVGIRQLISSCFDRPRLTFYGGEPLLAAPLIDRALQRIRKWAPSRMRPQIQIVTNGTLLDEEMSRLLVSENVSIMLSFDGISPAQNDRHLGSFESLDRLLVRLRRNHPGHFRTSVTVKVTLTSRNVAFLAASFRYFLSRRVPEVDVYPVLPNDSDWGARTRRELDQQLAEIVQSSLREFRRTGEIPFRAFRGTPLHRYGPACACGSRRVLFVDVDGALAPCPALARSTLRSSRREIHHVAAELGGVRITDRHLSAALLRRERRARALPFLAGPEMWRGSNGPCTTCEAITTCFVCPVAVDLDGRVPSFHCDVNRLLGRHRAAFRRKALMQA